MLDHPSNRRQRADDRDCRSHHARPTSRLPSHNPDPEAASVAFTRLIRASWACLPALCADITLPPFL